MLCLKWIVGGGICNTGTNCTITGGNITSNYAAHAGGGIYNLGNCTVKSCKLSGNSAFTGSEIYNKGRILQVI
jgi:predicted outer membrane repeat protein